MKIGLLIADSTAVGGAERSAECLFDGLDRSGYEAVYFYSMWNSTKKINFHSNEMVILESKPKYETKFASIILKLRSRFLKDKISVLIAVDPILVLLAVLATARTKIKVIGWEHTNVYASLGSKLRVPARKMLAKLQVPHVVLTKAAESGLHSFGLKSENIRKIGNLMPSGSVELNKNRSGAVFVGRLVESKNVIFLINIWSKVRRLYPGAMLDIIGDGPMRDSLERYVRESKQGSYISFLGYKEVNDNLLGKYKVMVSASQLEAQPMSLIEGVMAGLRVVAFGVSDAIDELCMKGPEGWHKSIENGNSEQFASAVASALDCWNINNALNSIKSMNTDLINRNIIGDWNDFISNK